MFSFLRCCLGPRLYRLYKTSNNEGKDYEGNSLEHYSDSIVKTTLISLSVAWSLGLYSSPLLASIMYRKGYFTSEGMYSICRLSGTVGIILFVSLLLRGIGRMMSSDYITFIAALDAYKKDPKKELKPSISQYDFEFHEWPVDFSWNETIMDIKKPKIYIKKSTVRRNTVDQFKSLPCGILSYIAIHTFGRMMIYPGSIGLLNVILAPMIIKGRSKLMEEYCGERFKLLAKDGNHIDSVFVDRRRKNNYPNGKILVICCEGNSGFYEYGITLTPIEAGYSVLGWNHPGFGSSTGSPYPDQELNAMDVVINFAITKLGFQFNEIVIYAWSIGGFSATWAAMNYPNIKGLVLDATFDDLVALAIARMPLSWKHLVVRTIRDYMDLNNAEQLSMYSGPVLMIRRTRDEIIATRPARSIQTNRGNDLLIKMMSSRFPKLVTNDTVWVLKDWLAGDKTHQSVMWSQLVVEEEICAATLSSYIEENGFSSPVEIGEDIPEDLKRQLIVYLADKYMVDFDSSHCVQLPARVFQLPWDIRFISNQIQQSHI